MPIPFYTARAPSAPVQAVAANAPCAEKRVSRPVKLNGKTAGHIIPGDKNLSAALVYVPGLTNNAERLAKHITDDNSTGHGLCGLASSVANTILVVDYRYKRGAALAGIIQTRQEALECVLAAVKAASNEGMLPKEIVVAGHSKGAGTALLAAIVINTLLNEKSPLDENALLGRKFLLALILSKPVAGAVEAATKVLYDIHDGKIKSEDIRAVLKKIAAFALPAGESAERLYSAYPPENVTALSNSGLGANCALISGGKDFVTTKKQTSDILRRFAEKGVRVKEFHLPESGHEFIPLAEALIFAGLTLTPANREATAPGFEECTKTNPRRNIAAGIFYAKPGGAAEIRPPSQPLFYAPDGRPPPCFSERAPSRPNRVFSGRNPG